MIANNCFVPLSHNRLSGADSYRAIVRFMQARLAWFQQLADCPWKTAPSVTGLRKLLLGMDRQAVEKALRAHAQQADPDAVIIAIDGKTLRGSVDHLADTAALQWISAFSVPGRVVLGQIELADGDKGGEIAVAQQLIARLGLTGKVFTLDAQHCQKKRSTSSDRPATTPSSRSNAISPACKTN
jgi:hypothetical protein